LLSAIGEPAFVLRPTTPGAEQPRYGAEEVLKCSRIAGDDDVIAGRDGCTWRELERDSLGELPSPQIQFFPPPVVELDEFLPLTTCRRMIEDLVDDQERFRVEAWRGTALTSSEEDDESEQNGTSSAVYPDEADSTHQFVSYPIEALPILRV
jgi:hypothetical protein